MKNLKVMMGLVLNQAYMLNKNILPQKGYVSSREDGWLRDTFRTMDWELIRKMDNYELVWYDKNINIK